MTYIMGNAAATMAYCRVPHYTVYRKQVESGWFLNGENKI
jgi:hypothetical protein